MNVPVSIGYMDFMTNVSELEETTFINKIYYESEKNVTIVKLSYYASKWDFLPG